MHDWTQISTISFIPTNDQPNICRKILFNCFDDDRPRPHAPATTRESTNTTCRPGSQVSWTRSTNSALTILSSKMFICWRCPNLHLWVVFHTCAFIKASSCGGAGDISLGGASAPCSNPNEQPHLYELHIYRVFGLFQELWWCKPSPPHPGWHLWQILCSWQVF